jgi:hypothetical protein
LLVTLATYISASTHLVSLGGLVSAVRLLGGHRRLTFPPRDIAKVRVVDAARRPLGEVLDVHIKTIANTQARIGELETAAHPLLHWLGQAVRKFRAAHVRQRIWMATVARRLLPMSSFASSICGTMGTA